MSLAHETEKDPAAFLTTLPNVPWRAVAVKAGADWSFHVKFIDGVEGSVEMKQMVWSPDAGVFAALRDTSLFSKVYLARGAVTWPGELDLAPDAMHDEIAKNGVWVLN